MSEPHPELVTLFRRLISRPVAVLMVVTTLVGMSLIAAFRIPIELIPGNLSDSWISVSAPWAGANPMEVEQRVVRPLEEELRTIQGVQHMVAVAAESRAIVNLGFSGSFDMDEAYAEVADRLERARPRLPREVDRIVARRFSTEDRPIVWCGLLFPPEMHAEAQGIIDEVLIPRIESVDGVASVTVHGLEPRSVRILLDEDRVQANRVDIGALVQRLQSDNLSSPVGDLDDGGQRYIVRVDGRFRSLEDIEDFPVRPGLKIRDIGRVILARSVPDNLMRIDGGYALGMAVSRETAANTFEVCKRLKEVLETELADDPLLGRLEYTIFWNEGEAVEVSLRDLVENAALGGLIAVVVLFLFLRRIGPTLLIALSIPFSVLATITWLYFRGDSFNLFTMMGITISIGMLVDNSVVIVESIFHRREQGDDLESACTKGPAEMVLAVVTATLTTVVVFLPLIFMSEDRNARVFTTSIGGPLCVALLSALVLAILIVPVASRHMSRRPRAGAAAARTPHLPAATRGLMPRLVGWALRHRLRALSLAVLFLLSGRLASSGNDFAPSLSFGGGQIQFDFELSPNLTLEEAEAAILPVEEALTGWLNEEIGSPDIGIFFDKEGGEINLWHDVRPNPDEQEHIRKVLREKLPRNPAVEVKIEDRYNRMSDDDESWVRAGIEGPDSQVVARLAERVRELARDSPDFETVAEEEDAAREMLVNLDRERLQRAGSTSQAVLGVIEWALRGFMVSRFETERGDIPIIMEFDEVEDPDRSRLRELTVAGFGAAPLPLSVFADFEHRRGPSAIFRRDGRTVDVVGLKPADKDLKKGAAALATLMEQVDLPEGYRWEQRGGWSDFQEDIKELYSAFILAVALVFLLMGLLFESIILPFSVLITIAFAVVGANWAFKLTGTPIDLVGMIGMIVLAGVVVNNGIVLVDRILRLQSSGMERTQAILRAVQDRQRPVIMTAATTIAGLLPIALAKPDGSGLSFQSLAIGVAGGLAFTTFFTLWVVPLLYTLFQDLGTVLRREVADRFLKARSLASLVARRLASK